MGGESPPNRAVVQSAGRSLLLRSSLFTNFNGLRVQNLLLRYTQALFRKLPDGVCNGIIRWNNNCAAGCCEPDRNVERAQMTSTDRRHAGVRREGSLRSHQFTETCA